MINENLDNLEIDDVLELIVDFPVEPYRNRIIVTANTVLPDFEETLDLTQVRFNETQFVIATGKHITDFVPGDRVLLDLEKLMVPVASESNSEETRGFLKLDPVTVNDRTFVMINDSYVKAIDRR